jgi:hypothetical protein
LPSGEAQRISAAVAVAALTISLVAVLVALGSLVLAVRADRRHGRAEVREERAEERAEAEAAARRQASPVVVPGAVDGGPTAETVRHRFHVRNAGRASLHDLRLWIEDGAGNVVSERGEAPGVLAPGDPAVEVGVRVPQPLPDVQVLWVGWRDDDGEQREDTGLRPRPHA